MSVRERVREKRVVNNSFTGSVSVNERESERISSVWWRESQRENERKRKETMICQYDIQGSRVGKG